MMRFRSIVIKLTILVVWASTPLRLHAQPPDCSDITLKGSYELSSKPVVRGHVKYAVKGEIDLDNGEAIGSYNLTTITRPIYSKLPLHA